MDDGMRAKPQTNDIEVLGPFYPSHNTRSRIVAYAESVLESTTYVALFH